MIGHGHAAGVPDPAVDDNRASVIAQVIMIDLPDPERSEHRYRATGRLQPFERVLRTTFAAQAVEQYAHLYAGPGAFDERIEDHVTQASGLPHVGREVDAGLGRRKVRQHMLEPFVAVIEQLGVPPDRNRYAQNRGQRAQELIGVNRRSIVGPHAARPATDCGEKRKRAAHESGRADSRKWNQPTSTTVCHVCPVSVQSCAP
jgi:hypothetical protein